MQIYYTDIVRSEQIDYTTKLNLSNLIHTV